MSFLLMVNGALANKINKLRFHVTEQEIYALSDHSANLSGA